MTGQYTAGMMSRETLQTQLTVIKAHERDTEAGGGESIYGHIVTGCLKVKKQVSYP